MHLHIDIDIEYSSQAALSLVTDIQLQGDTPGSGTIINAVLGTSGAGKSTLLRAIAGLIKPRRGVIAFGEEVWFDSQRGIDLPARSRRVGMVFQEYALFPHLTVAQNVGYGLHAAGIAPKEQEARIAEMLDLCGISALFARKPHELSGGERQRVALARAAAIRPRILLLDEPLSSLDDALRWKLQDKLESQIRQLNTPALLVTHDLSEATRLGDRVVLLDQGKVIANGKCEEVVDTPRTQAWARCVGFENFVEVMREGSDKKRVLAFRRGNANLCDQAEVVGVTEDGSGVVRGRIENIRREVEGYEVQVKVEGASGEVRVVAGMEAGKGLKMGDAAFVRIGRGVWLSYI